MSKIMTTKEADTFVKQNFKSSLNLIPVVMAEPQTIEGTDIKFWHILYQDSSRPNDQPKPSLIGGPTNFVLDIGQIISIPIRPPGPNSKSFKEVVLEQYQSDD